MSTCRIDNFIYQYKRFLNPTEACTILMGLNGLFSIVAHNIKIIEDLFFFFFILTVIFFFFFFFENVVFVFCCNSFTLKFCTYLCQGTKNPQHSDSQVYLSIRTNTTATPLG